MHANFARRPADSPSLLAAAGHWLGCLAVFLPPEALPAVHSLAQTAPAHTNFRGHYTHADSTGVDGAQRLALKISGWQQC